MAKNKPVTKFDDAIHMRCFKKDKEAFNKRCQALHQREPHDVMRELITAFGEGRVKIRRPDGDDINQATQELYT